MKIDKHVPYEGVVKTYGKGIATIRAMEVGDSVCFDSFKAAASFRVQACVHTKEAGKKFISRKTGPDTWRVWRIA